jgi:hypothetical protein
MKNIIILFLLTVSFQVSGQWYVKEYGVNDINSLSKTQLEESLKDTKVGLFTGASLTVLGGLCCAYYYYYKPGESDDPTVFEDIIGDDGVNAMGVVIGAGFAIGGTIIFLRSFVRNSTIHGALRRNYPIAGSFKLSPEIMMNKYTRSSVPGVRLTWTF